MIGDSQFFRFELILSMNRRASSTQIVLDAVRCTFQSYVEALKKSGGFDQKAQIYAFNLAKDTALKQLGDDAKTYISENYGDLQEWLKTEIEASINKLKN